MKPGQILELQYLMLRFFDGSIEEAEFEVLNRLLKESETARKFYFQYLKLYLVLKDVRYLSHLDCMDPADLENFLCALGQDESEAPAVLTETPGADEGPSEFKKLHVDKTFTRFKRSFYAALAVQAAILLIIAAVSFLPERKTANPVARILDDSQSRWSQEQTFWNRSLLVEGPLEVKQGTLKFAMYDGTEVILSAPATVSLEQIDRLFLREGQLRATVPPIAAGFTVCTPSGSIVDYGTEFSVAVDETQQTSVEVFKGVVELRNSSNPMLFNLSQRLTAGQTGMIDTAGQISWKEAPRPAENAGALENIEDRVRWQCSEPTGRWSDPAYWANGLVRGPTVVSEFRANTAPTTVLIDASVSGDQKILARRADVGLLGRQPVTVKMSGGQVQLEQLWVGRMSRSAEGEGRWIMTGGEVVLKGRDLVVLIVGDAGKGYLEINGGNMETFGTAKVGRMQGDGMLVMNGGDLTIYGFLEVASEESVGTVRLDSGVIRAFDLRIEREGQLLVGDGTLVLEGNKVSQLRQLARTGHIHVIEGELLIEYDEANDRGFGRDKTILRISKRE